jgi:hypothetical protein
MKIVERLSPASNNGLIHHRGGNGVRVGGAVEGRGPQTQVAEPKDAPFPDGDGRAQEVIGDVRKKDLMAVPDFGQTDVPQARGVEGKGVDVVGYRAESLPHAVGPSAGGHEQKIRAGRQGFGGPDAQGHRARHQGQNEEWVPFHCFTTATFLISNRLG